MKIPHLTSKRKFWLFISAPSILITILFVFTSLYTISIFRDQIKHHALSTLELFSTQNENVIMSTSSHLNQFEDNKDFMSFLNNPDITNSPYTDDVINSIKNLKSNFDYIDKVFVISKDKNHVLSSEGIFAAKTHFNAFYCYNDYSYDYWRNFDFFNSDTYRILSPTIINENGQEKQIIPIIFRQIGSSKIKNLIVVNLRLDVITKNSENFKYTPNTKFYIMNRYTGRIYSNYENQSDISITETNLYTNLTKNINTFDYKGNDGKKYTVFSYSSTDSPLGYTYFSTVPNSDLNKRLYPLITLMIASLIGYLVLIIVATSRSTNTLMSPLEQLAYLFNQDTPNRDIDIFDYLNTSATSLIKKNQNFSAAFPYAQEKYLIDYLNNTPVDYDTETEQLLKQSLPFHNNFFSCIIICVQPTSKFFEAFNSSDYANISQNLFGIMRELFANKFPTYALPSNKETYCIIINPESEESVMANIDETFNSISELLKNDSSYIELYTGIGNVYEDFIGLKKSYHDALKNLNVQPLGTPSLEIPTSKKTIKYTLSTSDETKLLSLLLAYNYDNAFSLINNYIEKNDNLDIRSLKQFYSQLLSIVFKAMRMKNIEYASNKNDTEIIADILTKSPDDIYKNILSLMQNFRINVLTGLKLDEKEIISYINDNFTNCELSLDALANKFNCSPTYLSTYLKNSLNMGYHQYITYLRIEEAKKLLKNSNKPIQDIYSEVGFSSKQTFIRAFKNLTTFTPSEYRKIEKN